MELCDICKSIPFEQLRGTGDLKPENWPTFDHQPSFQSLEYSATLCQLCRLVYTAIVSVHKVLSPINDETRRWLPYRASAVSRIKCQAATYPRVWTSHTVARVQSIKFYLDGLPDFVDVGHQADFRFSNNLYLSTLEDDPLASQFIHRYMEADPTSKLSTGYVRSWVKNCDVNHEACKGETRSNKYLPARLLDVRSSSTSGLNLVNTTDQSGPYVALSHCWGTSHTFMTTAETLIQRRENIDIDEMPHTFRDAIAVARRLGIRYVWIDSLCVIQDSKGDWTVESAKMSHIYLDAYLTISATCSQNDMDGFLRNRPQSTPVIIKYTLTSGVTASIFVQIKIHNIGYLHDTSYLVGRCPTSTRGWTLQEQYLSRRTLYYGTDQMFWTCPHNETGLTESGEDFFDNFNLNWLLYGKTTFRSHNETHRLIHQDSAAWYSMIGQYMLRALTVPSDKLPAISGLAHVYLEKKGRSDAYLAGIWKSTILHGLQWERECNAAFKSVLTEPTQYVAPSWSWASVNGRIAYPKHLAFDTWRSTVPLTRLLSSRIDLLSENDECGEVKGGKLVLETILLRVYLRGSDIVLETGEDRVQWESNIHKVDLQLPEPSPQFSKLTIPVPENFVRISQTSVLYNEPMTTIPGNVSAQSEDEVLEIDNRTSYVLGNIVAHAGFDYEEFATAVPANKPQIVMVLGRFKEDYGLPVTSLILAAITGEENTFRRVGVMKFSWREIPDRKLNYKKFEVLDDCATQVITLI